MSTTTSRFTPAKRLALAIATLAYIFASHDALAGGFLLQAVWIVLGFGLVRLLIGSAVPAALGWPLGRRVQRAPAQIIERPARAPATLAYAEAL